MLEPITSLMFCTYNRLNCTEQMMRSLDENTTTPYRICIIDNASTDNTVQFLKEYKPTNPNCLTYDVKFNEENKGIAVGRNQALVMANKYNDPYLSTLDNDVILDRAWLKNCVDFIEENPFFSIGINFEDVRYPIKKYGNKEIQLKPKGNLGTACTVFGRGLHNAIGFFCMDFGLYSCDDSDFFFRARMAGFELGYLPKQGTHIGVGENDSPEYREWKTQMHKQTLNKFYSICGALWSKKRPIYQPFEDK